MKQVTTRIAALLGILGLVLWAMLVQPAHTQAAFPTMAVGPQIATLTASPTSTATITASYTVSSTWTTSPTSSAPHIQSGPPVLQSGTADLIISDVRLGSDLSTYRNCDLSDEIVLIVVIANYGQAETHGTIALNVHPIGTRLKTTVPTVSLDSLGAGKAREIRLPMNLIGGDGVEMEVVFLGLESSKDNNRLIVTWKQLLLSYTPVPRCTPTQTPTVTLTPSITLTPSFGPSPTWSDIPTATST